MSLRRFRPCPDFPVILVDASSFLESNPVICIVGPTASGKTFLAQKLAEHFAGEVISADSMQIYRGMDIGTGKIPQEQRTVPYYGLDLCDPGEPYSAAAFQDYARTCFRDIAQCGSRSILCGGTGLYVRAAIDDYQFPQGDQAENPARDHFTELLKEIGPQALWEQLRNQDPESAELIHPNNSRRVIRAFEMLDEGVRYADMRENLETIKQVVPARLIGLAVDPDILNRLIEDRVDTMIEQGLVDEVNTLLQQGFRSALTAKQAIGYKEIVAAIEGKTSLDEAVEQIKTATRRYGKRQRTWFRKDKRITWINANDANTATLTEQAIALLS